MKILIASDSYKGSLSSLEVSKSIQKGFKEVYQWLMEGKEQHKLLLNP